MIHRPIPTNQKAQFCHFSRNFHITIDSNTPLCQDTLAPAALALADALQAKQIKATQLQMQLLQKESNTKLAYKAEEATLKRRRDKELYLVCQKNTLNLINLIN